MSGERDLQDRLQRAESWIRAAERLEARHAHESFVFYYIALNAMYGRRQYEGGRTEVRDDIDRFLTHIKTMHERDVDQSGNILGAALNQCRAHVEALILDHFLLDDLFRGTQRAKVVSRCKRELIESRLRWKATGDFFPALRVALLRLTVLRNRVMHGCVTYGPTSKGMPSIAKGVRVGRVLVPALLDLMRKHGHTVKWDPIPYPRVGFEDPLERLEPE